MRNKYIASLLGFVALAASVGAIGEEAIDGGSAATPKEENSGSYVCAGGKKGLTYNKICNRLVKIIPGGSVVQTKGSVENVEMLLSKKADIVVAQLDFVANDLDKNPENDNEYTLAGELYDECIHVAVHKDGKVRNEDDLQSKGVSIAVGKPGSGTMATWAYLQELESGYKKATPVMKDGPIAFNNLLMSNTSSKGVDAVMWVTRPSIKGKYTRLVAKNKDLEIISFNDSDLNDTHKVLGVPIYKFKKIPVEEGTFSDTKVQTPCTSAVLLVRSDREDLLEKVSDIMLSYKSSLVH